MMTMSYEVDGIDGARATITMRVPTQTQVLSALVGRPRIEDATEKIAAVADLVAWSLACVESMGVRVRVGEDVRDGGEACREWLDVGVPYQTIIALVDQHIASRAMTEIDVGKSRVRRAQ